MKTVVQKNIRKQIIHFAVISCEMIIKYDTRILKTNACCKEYNKATFRANSVKYSLH